MCFRLSLFSIFIWLITGQSYAQMGPPPMGPRPGFQGMPPPPPRMNAPAQNMPMRDDSRRPVDQISRDLGVTPDQFRTCFNNVTPAPQGSLPNPNQKQANKQYLLSCLQKSNPDISNDSLDTVMDRYRPGGSTAQ